MDLMMEIRRRLLEIATGGGDVGAEVIKGTFTAANQGGNLYTINFGKTFSEYMYLIRLSATGLASLKSSGQTAARMYECVGHYPRYDIQETLDTGNAFLSYRLNPSNDELSVSNSSNSGSATGSSLSMTTNQYAGGANILYTGLEYEYFIVSLDGQ